VQQQVAHKRVRMSGGSQLPHKRGCVDIVWL
jgi:hypothetical protein